MRIAAVRFLRLLIAVSPVYLAVVGVLTSSNVTPLLVSSLALAGFLSVFGAVSTASSSTPGASLLYGLTALYPRRSNSTARAQQLVAGARTSVKVLDTYWGAVNEFRPAIQDALSRPGVVVQILLIEDAGGVATAREFAMPGEINLATNLPACLDNIDGLRRQLEQVSQGAGQRVQVRRYDAIVMGPLLIVDDAQVIAGTFLQSAGSPMTPAFEFVRRRLGSNRVVDHFVATFDKIWATARPQNGLR